MSVSKQKLISGFAGAALAASAALSLSAIPASAQETTASPSPSVDGKVQYVDVRNETDGVIRIASYETSGRGRIALLVKGGDDDLLREIYSVAEQIENNTGRDVWFLHSVDDLPDDDTIEVDIYVSGRETGTILIKPLFKNIDDLLRVAVNDGIRQTNR